MSEIYQVIILPEAQQDMQSIVLYIARQLSAPEAALNLKSAFQKEIALLSHMPKRFQTIQEQPWGNAGIRKFRVKNYYVYYLVDDADKTVKVNAVIYVGRDQPKQMSKRNMPQSSNKKEINP